MLDHTPIRVAALDGDDRTFEVEVAGPTALLIAKAFKLQERLDRPGRPDRLHDKDAGDVYRLMQSADPAHCAAVAAGLMAHEIFGDTCREGLGYLTRLFRGQRTAGTAMAIDHFRGALSPERVVDVVNSFVRTFRADLDGSRG